LTCSKNFRGTNTLAYFAPALEMMSKISKGVCSCLPFLTTTNISDGVFELLLSRLISSLPRESGTNTLAYLVPAIETKSSRRVCYCLAFQAICNISEVFFSWLISWLPKDKCSSLLCNSNRDEEQNWQECLFLVRFCSFL
jgi:hypothetical protein